MEPYESELLKAWPIFDKVVLEGTSQILGITQCDNCWNKSISFAEELDQCIDINKAIT